MKTKILLLIGLLLLSCSIANSKGTNTVNNPTKEETINVLASPDLFNLTMQWASEYCRVNPDVKINVVNAAENANGAANATTGISILSAEALTAISDPSSWSIVIGRNVIVPVMNSKNPLLDEIRQKGITREGLARIFETASSHNWGVLLENGKNIPLHYYTSSDVAVNSAVESYLNNDKVVIGGIAVNSGQEMISVIQKDPDGFGFCKLIHLMAPGNSQILDNISLVPIDKNENGKIDFMENIYDNLQDLSRGVWIGKYPKVLSGNIYAAASMKPESSTETAFLQWVLTGGQEFLSPNGYCDLVSGERQTQLDKLRNTTITIAAPENDTYAVVKIVLLVLIAFAMIGFIMDIIGRYFRSKKAVLRQEPLTSSTVFDEESVVVPKGLFFDKTHTWAFMAEDGNVKIGIDDFLQHITGPITRIEMKNTGEKIKKGDRLLTLVQKGKQLTIHAPLTGTIIAQNKTLATNTSMLNTAPYTDGWVYTIEPSNWLLEIQFLTMAEKYRTWLKGEFTRLKDFFATAVNAGTPEYAHIAYQDGGAFKDHILADLGPAVWEDFQTNFIDNSK